MKYMFLFFMIVFYFVGNLICDFFAIYLVELGVTTYYVGSISLYAFSYWAYISMLSVFDYIISPYYYKNSISSNYKIDQFSITNFCSKYGRQIVFILGLLLLLKVFNHPSFLYDVNRFAYMKKYMSGFLLKTRTVPLLLAPMVLLSALNDKKLLTTKKKIISIILAYIPYLLFGLWIGNKFGLFWVLFYSMAIPCTPYINFKKLNNIKFIKICFLIVLLLATFLMAFYLLHGNTGKAIIQKLFRRFSAQGEIWWSVVADENSGKLGLSGFTRELNDILTSIKTGGMIKKYGVYKIMDMYGSQSYLKHYYDIDMRLSALGFELSYYFWGWLSFFIFPLVTIPFYVIITNSYINSIMHKNFISSIVLLRVLTTYNSSICQGDWYRMLSKLDIMLYLLLIIDICVRINNQKIFKLEEKK